MLIKTRICTQYIWFMTKGLKLNQQLCRLLEKVDMSKAKQSNLKKKKKSFILWIVFQKYHKKIITLSWLPNIWTWADTQPPYWNHSPIFFPLVSHMIECICYMAVTIIADGWIIFQKKICIKDKWNPICLLLLIDPLWSSF